MKYAKVDTTLRDHPKALTAGPLAMGVWLGALLYCRDQLTDGFVPDAAIPTFFGGGHLNGRAAQKLVAIGLFSRTDGGYLLAGYADKNDTKAVVTAAIEKKQKAQKKWKENTKREAGDNLQILSPHSHSHSLLSVSESGEGEPEREAPVQVAPSLAARELRYRTAVASGIAAGTGSPCGFGDQPWQQAALNRAITTHAPKGAKGSSLDAWLTERGKAYGVRVKSTQATVSLQGFEAWLSSGAPGPLQRVGASGRPDPAPAPYHEVYRPVPLEGEPYRPGADEAAGFLDSLGKVGGGAK